MRPYRNVIFKIFWLFWPLMALADLQPVYSPHGSELIYPGIFQNASSLGHYGVALNGRISSQRNDSSAFAFTGAFPLSLKFREDDRNSGWAFGFGAGISSYVYEPQKFLSPGLYFWEAMLGRGSNHADRNIQTGLLGFFEVTLRNERPNHQGDQLQILAHHNRVVEPHRYSLNLRIGSSFSPLGEGIVRQNPGRFSTSVFLYLSAPIQNPEWRASLHLQGLLRTWKKLLLVTDLGIFGSYADDRILDKADDLRAIYFWGPRLEYRRPRQSFALGAQWKYFQGAQEKHFKNTPTFNSSYQLAF